MPVATTHGELIAVSVGRPREIEWQGRVVRTSIFKAEVAGRVRVGATNLEGDEQSDQTVHGGPNKSVYAYPSEHYAYWAERLPGMELPWGAFGENLSVRGFRESEMRIGDLLGVGTAQLRVTQPRFPCAKLGVRFQRLDMTKLFHESRRFGFYLTIVKQGELGAGDRIEWLERDPRGLTVADIIQLDTEDVAARELLATAATHPYLPEGRRERYASRLADLLA